MSKELDYYEILGVSRDAEDVVIRGARQALLKKYHPDVYKQDTHFAETRTKQINEAYEILIDPAKRARYDGARRGGSEKRQTAGEPGRGNATGPQDASGRTTPEAPANTRKTPPKVMMELMISVAIVVTIIVIYYAARVEQHPAIGSSAYRDDDQAHQTESAPRSPTSTTDAQPSATPTETRPSAEQETAQINSGSAESMSVPGGNSTRGEDQDRFSNSTDVATVRYQRQAANLSTIWFGSGKSVTFYPYVGTERHDPPHDGVADIDKTHPIVTSNFGVYVINCLGDYCETAMAIPDGWHRYSFGLITKEDAGNLKDRQTLEEMATVSSALREPEPMERFKDVFLRPERPRASAQKDGGASP